MTLDGVIISAPLAVAAPLNIPSTAVLNAATIAPSVTYSAVPLIWYPSRLFVSYAEIAIFPSFAFIFFNVVSRKTSPTTSFPSYVTSLKATGTTFGSPSAHVARPT